MVWTPMPMIFIRFSLSAMVHYEKHSVPYVIFSQGAMVH